MSTFTPQMYIAMDLANERNEYSYVGWATVVQEYRLCHWVIICNL